MAIAIIGASGEIGARLAQNCLSKNIAVRLLVRSVDPRIARWGNVDIRRVDVSNRAALKEALTGCTAIINCALDKSELDNEEQNIQRNKTFFTNLAELSIELGIGKIVELSSIAVLPPRVTADVLNGDYNYSAEPDWYTRVKSQVEQLALSYKDKVSITILRPGIVYGPYMHWSRFAFMRTQQNSWVLPNAPDSLCHAIHVDDLADLMLFCADKNNNTPTLLYGINPERVSWQEFYNSHTLILEGYNKRPTVLKPLAELRYLEKVEGDEMRKPGLKRSIIDFARKMYAAIPSFVTESSLFKKLRYKLKAMNYGLLNYDNYLKPPAVAQYPLTLPSNFEIELYLTNATPANDKNGVAQGFVYKTTLKQGAKQAAMWWKFRL
jgi:nucleoside-diphosphate-sugar epimerase